MANGVGDDSRSVAQTQLAKNVAQMELDRVVTDSQAEGQITRARDAVRQEADDILLSMGKIG